LQVLFDTSLRCKGGQARHGRQRTGARWTALHAAAVRAGTTRRASQFAPLQAALTSDCPQCLCARRSSHLASSQHRVAAPGRCAPLGLCAPRCGLRAPDRVRGVCDGGEGGKRCGAGAAGPHRCGTARQLFARQPSTAGFSFPLPGFQPCPPSFLIRRACACRMRTGTAGRGPLRLNHCMHISGGPGQRGRRAAELAPGRVPCQAAVGFPFSALPGFL